MESEKCLLILLTEVKTRQSEIKESLGSGGAIDFPAYREMCGSIRGLLFAQDLIEDLLRKLRKDEDE